MVATLQAISAAPSTRKTGRSTAGAAAATARWMRPAPRAAKAIQIRVRASTVLLDAEGSAAGAVRTGRTRGGSGHNRAVGGLVRAARDAPQDQRAQPGGGEVRRVWGG